MRVNEVKARWWHGEASPYRVATTSGEHAHRVRLPREVPVSLSGRTGKTLPTS